MSGGELGVDNHLCRQLSQVKFLQTSMSLYSAVKLRLVPNLRDLGDLICKRIVESDQSCDANDNTREGFDLSKIFRFKGAVVLEERAFMKLELLFYCP
jgi:hypothetical protein